MPLFRVHMPSKAELLPALEEVLWSGYIGQGAKVAQFEDALAAYLGNRNVLTVSSGTSAIQLALRLAGVRGGSVVTTPMTCTATNMPVLAEGGRIIWADIDPSTGNIDPADAERKIEAGTRAILAVHWGGQPCDMDALMQVGRRRGIPVIEDAAHALGAEWGGRKIGAATADYTAFSLQAIKHITTVDGGILATADGDAYRRGKLLRWYGIDRDSDRRDSRCEQDIPEWGYKFHMNDVAATVGLAQLPHLPAIVEAHRANAEFYGKHLYGRVKAVPPAGKGRGAWWLYTLLLEDEAQRGRFTEYMHAAGIAVSRVHIRNDIHPCFAASRRGPLPGVDEFSSRMCCIPVHWALSEADRQRVADAVCSFCEQE